jgi:hypothetical protein
VERRAVIVDIAQASEDVGAMVTITLDYAGTEHRGAAIGSSRPRERPRLIGEATLKAVESIAGGAVSLELLAIGATDVGDSRVAVAQVGFGPDEVLVGSALIRDEDPPDWAAGRAVMDALNRRLAALLEP